MTNATSKVAGLPFFTDLYGHALDVGNVYIGQPNTDPRQFPMTVYFDEAETIPVAQPIKVLSGHMTKTGSVAEIFLTPPYSIYVEDKRGQQLYYLPSVDDPIVAAVGSLTSLVVPNIAALRLVDTTRNGTFNVTSYYSALGLPDGGGGIYRFDSTDTTSVDNGGTVIVTSTGSRLKLQWFGSVSALQFGIKADAGTTDNTTQMQAARDWVASGAVRNKLTFPAGIYGYSVSPNWGIQNAQIEAQGEVRLRYSGTGNAVILDTGPTLNTFTYNVTMGRFIVEAPATAGHGVYVRSIHHSSLDFKVEGCGADSDGIRVDFAVCTKFNMPTVTANEAGNWYLNAKPLNGIHLAARNAGEQTSYCTLDTPVVEGLSTTGGAGILLDGTIGNVFIGGTAEACAYGILTGATAAWNKFFGIDLEANVTDDIYEQGTANHYLGVDSGLHVTVSGVAHWPVFRDGSYQSILVGSGAQRASFSRVGYNRAGSGSFTNSDVSTMIDDQCFDLQSLAIGPFPQGGITVGASPFNYTNTTGNPMHVSITGGTVTSITRSRGGVDSVLPGVIGEFRLMPGDILKLAYTAAAPNMYQWRM